MRAQRPNGLGRAIEQFFREYLPTLRGVSPHTIRNYRDAIVLFLQFTSIQTERAIEDLDLADFTAQRVQAFLAFLEAERHNGIATRNARLAALHTFARFLVTEQPAQLAELQRVLGVPFKRGARNTPIEYLEPVEVEALLNSIDRTTPAGKRDYALFALMLNTGARVQEILDLRLCDIRTEPPQQVRLRGKGGKTRTLPDLAANRAASAGSLPRRCMLWRQRSAAVRQPSGGEAHALRRRIPAQEAHRRRSSCSRHPAGEADPPAFPTAYDGDFPAEIWRRLRHHQPVAWPFVAEHNDDLCQGGSGSQTPSANAGISGNTRAAARWPRDLRSSQHRRLAEAALSPPLNAVNLA